MKVSQYKHANQFIITTSNKVSLQSYKSEVVRIVAGKGVYLGKAWDFSATTRRHVYAFLEEYAGILLPDKGRAAFIRNKISSREIGTI